MFGRSGDTRECFLVDGAQGQHMSLAGIRKSSHAIKQQCLAAFVISTFARDCANQLGFYRLILHSEKFPSSLP